MKTIIRMKIVTMAVVAAAVMMGGCGIRSVVKGGYDLAFTPSISTCFKLHNMDSGEIQEVMGGVVGVASKGGGVRIERYQKGNMRIEITYDNDNNIIYRNCNIL